MTVLYWEWHIIPRWLLRRIFARFSLLKLPQSLGNLRKSWQAFHDRLLLGRFFRDFVMPMLDAHRYTYAPILAAEPRSIAWLLFLCRYPCGTILVTTYSMWGPRWFQEQDQCLFLGLAARSSFSSTVFPFTSFILWVGILGWGLRPDIVWITLS